jgi:hypothetical protein
MFVVMNVMAYQAILEKGRVWIIDIEKIRNEYSSNGEVDLDDNLIYFSYMLGGDSIVNNLIYKKVYRRYCRETVWKFDCLVREDLNEKKLWRHSKGETILLVDFNISVGDSIDNCGVCTNIEYVKDKKGKLLKKFTFDRSDNVWVEGYGFVRKLLPHELYFLNSVRDSTGVLITFKEVKKNIGSLEVSQTIKYCGVKSKMDKMNLKVKDMKQLKIKK